MVRSARFAPRRGTPSRAAFVLAALLALVLAVLAVLAVTGPASAAGGTASTARATLALDGSAAKRLRSAGVTVTASRKATVRRTTVTLPVSVAVVGTTAAVGLDGTIAFRAGKRTLSLRGLRVMVARNRTVQVLGRTTGGQFPFLTGTVAMRALTLDAFNSSAAFTATPVKLTARAARLLRTTLRLRRTPSGILGRLTLLPAGAATTTTTAPGSPTTGTQTTAGEPTPTLPGGTTPITPVDTTPGPRVCEPTAPAGGSEDWDLPPTPTAVAITSACITWHPRDSWTNYINGGEGAALGGEATADPSNTACGVTPLPRSFHFPFRRGWYDPTTGQAVLQYNGLVRYGYVDHGIDISFQNPELQLGTPVPQATFRHTAGAGGRTPVLALDTTTPLAAQCAVDPGPKNSHDPAGARGAHVYERLHATVSSGAAPLLDSGGAGGSYPAGSDFGWLSASFTPAS